MVPIGRPHHLLLRSSPLGWLGPQPNGHPFHHTRQLSRFALHVPKARSVGKLKQRPPFTRLSLLFLHPLSYGGHEVIVRQLVVLLGTTARRVRIAGSYQASLAIK